MNGEDMSSGQDSDGGLPILIAIFSIIAIILWALEEHFSYIAYVWKLVRYGEMWVLQLIPDFILDNISIPIREGFQLLKETPSANFSPKDVNYFDNLFAKYLAWIPGFFLIYLGINRIQGTIKVARIYDIESLMAKMSAVFTHAKEFVDVSPEKMDIAYQPGDKLSSAYGIALSPFEFSRLKPPLGMEKDKNYQGKRILCHDNGQLYFDSELCAQVFQKQLGNYFCGLEQLNSTEKKVYALFEKRVSYTVSEMTGLTKKMSEEIFKGKKKQQIKLTKNEEVILDEVLKHINSVDVKKEYADISMDLVKSLVNKTVVQGILQKYLLDKKNNIEEFSQYMSVKFIYLLAVVSKIRFGNIELYKDVSIKEEEIYSHIKALYKVSALAEKNNLEAVDFLLKNKELDNVFVNFDFKNSSIGNFLDVRKNSKYYFVLLALYLSYYKIDIIEFKNDKYVEEYTLIDELIRYIATQKNNGIYKYINFSTARDFLGNPHFVKLMEKYQVGKYKNYIKELEKVIDVRALYLTCVLEQIQLDLELSDKIKKEEIDFLDFMKKYMLRQNMEIIPDIEYSLKLMANHPQIKNHLDKIDLDLSDMNRFSCLKKKPVIGFFIFSLYYHLRLNNVFYSLSSENDKKLYSALKNKILSNKKIKSLDNKTIQKIIMDKDMLPHYQRVKSLSIMKQHAYVKTGLMSLLDEARKSGVYATLEFRWLKSLDRGLWYAMSSVGRKTSFVESGGVFAHWLFELEMKRPIFYPEISEAVKGLKAAVYDGKTV